MRQSRTEYIVEWVDADTLKSRALAAIRKASRKGVEAGSPPLDEDAELDEYPLDWCLPEAAAMTRRFPSLPMAKAWATKNRDRDWFSEPRVFVNLFTPTSPWPLEDEETIEEWRFDGGDTLEKQAP